jgi:hypothetical protein
VLKFTTLNEGGCCCDKRGDGVDITAGLRVAELPPATPLDDRLFDGRAGLREDIEPPRM